MTVFQTTFYCEFEYNTRRSRSVGFAHENQDILPLAKKQNRPIYFLRAKPTLLFHSLLRSSEITDCSQANPL